MIRVTAIYPNTAGSHFDAVYYNTTHAALAQSMLRPHGLAGLRVVLGISDLGGAPPPYWAVSEMLFESRAAFDAAMIACGAQLNADTKNYTDTIPVLQLSALASELID